MHGEVFKLWAEELGPVELTVSQLLKGASKQLRGLFLSVAADQQRRSVCPRRLGHWLASTLGKSADGWKLERRDVHNQAAWRLAEVPLDIPPPAPLVFDPDAKAPDLLNGNLILALKKDREILNWPLDRDDPKAYNAIITTCTSTKATAVKVDQNRLMAERSPDALERVINRVKQLVKERDATRMIDVGPTVQQEACAPAVPVQQEMMSDRHEVEDIQEVAPEPEEQAMMTIKQSPLPDPEPVYVGQLGDAQERYRRTGVRPPHNPLPRLPRALPLHQHRCPSRRHSVRCPMSSAQCAIPSTVEETTPQC